MTQNHTGVSRRAFLAGSAGIAALAATGNYAFAAGADSIKIGVVGCGGRGRDAVQNAVASADGVEVWAVADAFKDRADAMRQSLGNLGDKNKVTDDRTFVGLDAYKKVLASGVNYIILATNPGYRPLHLRAAIEAGVNVFAEKPIATCPTGIRSVMETAKLATQKNLAIVAGTQRRHQPPYVETIKRIRDGALGEILAAQVYWIQGGMWAINREPSMTDFEWQVRNWQYFTRFGGDQIVEQHIHNLDVANWALGGHPVRALGMGGRQVRLDPLYGHVYDHFAVEFEYPNGVRVTSMCRQQDGTSSRVSERVVGTKGWSDPSGRIQTDSLWRYDGATPNPYVQEHTDNIAAIRAGKPLNEGQRIAESTLTAIMGRESCYSGQEVTWDQILNSKLDLRPDELTWGPLPTPPVAMPGKYRLA